MASESGERPACYRSGSVTAAIRRSPSAGGSIRPADPSARRPPDGGSALSLRVPQHVVLGPPPAELAALDGQLADELVERRVVGEPAGVQAQGGDVVARDGLPVEVALARERV